ncbi:hypothetical protein L6164_031292 [Bauhinia variegata]|uniref:Uncharacterized protein n=1 Tax=Bauhinia variegata TaxID=167791 RepID=A0ACB9LEV7_BAUVA|nr:hypothetical protein L6164_031292 [Bauhinia variegata]
MTAKLLLCSRPICSIPSNFYAFHVYLKPFSSISSFSIEGIETQLKSLCKNPNPQYSEAFSLFDRSVDSNLVPSELVCNFLIGNLRKAKLYDLVVSVYCKMSLINVLPRFNSLSCLVESFVNTEKPTFAVAVLGMMIKRGFEINKYNVNLILKGFCRNSNTKKAMDLFLHMRRNDILPDRISYNTLINGLCKAKKLKEARDLFMEMKLEDCQPDLVTYTTLIDGLSKNDRVDEAFDLLKEMDQKGLDADVVVYSALINGFCNRGGIHRAKELFHEMLKKGISPNVVTYSCFMHSLSKNGQWQEASEMFDEMTSRGIYPDVIAYTVLINGLCKNGMALKAMQLLNLMVQKGESQIL